MLSAERLGPTPTGVNLRRLELVASIGGGKLAACICRGRPAYGLWLEYLRSIMDWGFIGGSGVYSILEYKNWNKEIDPSGKKS